MNSKYYYITKNYNTSTSAVSKAKIDCEDILNKLGFVNIGLSRTHIKNPILSFFITLFGIFKAILIIKKRSTICIQYPFKKYYNFIVFIAKIKRCSTITIIHDLRSHRKEKLSIKSEIKSLNRNTYIISHNQKMTDWLNTQGLNTKIVNLNIFDYLGNGKSSTITYPLDLKFNIVFAGVLSPSKNNFIYKMDDLKPSNYSVNLYGVGFNRSDYKGSLLNYKGSFNANDIIKEIDGHFGLVWDGDTYEECTGAFGQYLMYNNPHKTSLYLRAGLPVITWNKAAIADFIIENNVGFVISSLGELEERLKDLSEDKYHEIHENCLTIGKKLEQGYYLDSAMHQIKDIEISDKR